jgi:AbrB family looped-hinge helix DNA binding protein
MFESTITSKGQTTVPSEIRKRFNLRSGDRVLWHVEEGRIVLRAKNRSIKDLVGMLHRPGQRPISVEEMDEAIAQAAAESGLTDPKPTR